MPGRDVLTSPTVACLYRPVNVKLALHETDRTVEAELLVLRGLDRAILRE